MFNKKNMLNTVFEGCDFFTPEVKIRPGIRNHICRNRWLGLADHKKGGKHYSQPNYARDQPEWTISVAQQISDTAKDHRYQDQCRKEKHKKRRQTLIDQTICFVLCQSPSVFKCLKIFRPL